ncbi:213_t:CDS:2, partial [Ambispora gerdemannii]
ESGANSMANAQAKLISSIAVRPDDIINNGNNHIDTTLEQTSGVVSSVSPQTISGGENSPPTPKFSDSDNLGVTTSWVWSHLKKDETQKLVLCQVSVLNKEGEPVPCAHQFQMSTSTSNLATHLRSQHQIYDPSKASVPGATASVSAPTSSINPSITSVAVSTNGFHGSNATTSGINSMMSSTPILMRSPSLQMSSSIAMPSSHQQVQILQQPLNQQHQQQHQLLIHPPSIPFSYQQQQSPSSQIPRQSFAPLSPERIKMHNKDKQNRLVAKLVAWLVDDSQPFKLIDNQKFRDFCQEMDPRFNLPSINSLNTFTELGLGDFIQSTPSSSSSSSNVLVPVKRPANVSSSSPSPSSNTSTIEGIASPSKRLKSTSSWVWNHLRKDDSTKIVTCQVIVLNEKNEEVQCGHLFQYSTSTSNLASHLRGTHRILDANTPYTPTRAATTRTNATNAPTTFRTRSTSPTTNPSTSRTHPKEKQERLIFKLVAWMVDDLQPFKLLNSVKFREFCHDMDPKFMLPSIEQIQQIIVDSANGIQEKLVHLTQKSMISFSYTTELWSNDQNSFIAVYVHWITDKFIQRKALLDVGTLPINPTNEHLSQALKDLFDRWQISDKLLATVNDIKDNDNSKISNSLKADHVLCAAHIINTSIESGLAKCDHTLKKATALNDFLVHRVDKHRDRFFGIQAMVRSDKQLYQAIKQESGNWNSIYLVLERLLTLRSATEVLQTVLVRDADVQIKNDGNDLAKLLLADEEWEVVQEIIFLLKPFTQVIEFTEFREENSSLGIMFQAILKLFIHLNQSPQNIKRPSILEVQKEILSTMNKHWKSPEPLGLLATLLDPRFKSLHLLPEKKREEAAKLLNEKVAAFGDVDAPVGIIKKPSTDCGNPLAAFFDDDLTSSANKTEVDLYLRLPELAKNENKGALEWWLENASKFPGLALQARIYLGIPGICAPAGRVFSEDSEQKVLLNGKRQQLDPNFVHYIMLFKENSTLFENTPYPVYFN